MLRAKQSYQNDDRCILLLFDLRDPGACEQIHRLRASWQANSILEALGPDHMIVLLFPGATQRLAA